MDNDAGKMSARTIRKIAFQNAGPLIKFMAALLSWAARILLNPAVSCTLQTPDMTHSDSGADDAGIE